MIEIVNEPGYDEHFGECNVNAPRIVCDFCKGPIKGDGIAGWNVGVSNEVRYWHKGACDRAMPERRGWFWENLDKHLRDLLFNSAAEVKAAPRTTPPVSYAKARNRITPQVRWRILQRDGFRCVDCGRPASETRLEVDHKVPVCKGGASEDENLRTLCCECNRGKGTQMDDSRREG